MADQTTRRGPSSEPRRQRRSDQHWRSRRRRRKREREQRREERARQKAELAARRDEVVQVNRTLPPESEASPEEALAEAGLADDLGRTERRLLAQERRRRAGVQKGVRFLTVGALVAAAVGLGVGLRLLTEPDDAAPEQQAEAGLPEGVDPQPTLLLATAAEDADPRSAQLLMLLAHDRVSGDSTVLLVPASTVADIPGHGVLPIGDALAFGGPGLVSATVDNLLGIHVDGVADLTYRDWAGLFSRVGPVQVEVEERLVARNEDGSGDVRFLAGTQSLDPEAAAEFLAFRSDLEPELSALPRVQKLLLAELTAMAVEPGRLDEVLADGIPMIDTEMPTSELVDLLRQLAIAASEERLDVRVLPVRPIGAAGTDGYRPDTPRVEELVADRFGASVPTVDRIGRQLQILNGMGRPGIGQSVAEQLVPSGYRVVLTGNADDFDHEQTRIVIYRDTPEQVAIANEIKRLLGVGVVEISLTPQSVVDVTIVVGRDYGELTGAS